MSSYEAKASSLYSEMIIEYSLPIPSDLEDITKEAIEECLTEAISEEK